MLLQVGSVFSRTKKQNHRVSNSESQSNVTSRFVVVNLGFISCLPWQHRELTCSKSIVKIWFTWLLTFWQHVNLSWIKNTPDFNKVFAEIYWNKNIKKKTFFDLKTFSEYLVNDEALTVQLQQLVLQPGKNISNRPWLGLASSNNLFLTPSFLQWGHLRHFVATNITTLMVSVLYVFVITYLYCGTIFFTMPLILILS